MTSRSMLLWPSAMALVAASLPPFHGALGWVAVWLTLLVGLGFAARARALAVESGAEASEVWNRSFVSQGRPAGSRARLLPFAALMLVAFALGFCRGLYWRKAMDIASRLASRRRPLSIWALALDVPKESGSGTSFSALVLDVGVVPPDPHDPLIPGFRGQKMVVRAKTTPGSVGVLPGDIVSLTGRLTIPSPAMNPGQFDYQKYLQSKRVFSLLDGTVSPLPLEDQGSWSRSWCLTLRRSAVRAMAQFGQSVRSSLDRSLPPEDAAILKAMLLANDDGLEGIIEDDFRRVGLSRLLSLTGFHVDAVSWAIYSIIQRATRRYNLSRLSAVVSAAVLAWASGWTAGAIRALVSVSMRFIAPLVRRRYDPMASLSFGALVVAWAIPSPLGDVSFKMSFLGALGAFVGGRYLHSGSLGMAAALIPMMTQYFRDVSVTGLIMGGLWASAVSSVAILTLAVLAFPCGTAVFGWLPYLASRGVRLLTSLVSRIPGASVSLPALSWGEMASWYALLVLWAWHAKGHLKGGRGCESRDSEAGVGVWARRILFVAAAACLFASAWIRAYPPWPEIAFLSVGQGDSAVIRYRDVCIMVDTGTDTQFQRSVLPYLRYRGVSRIDLCVLSHLHSDHAGGISALCSQFEVEALLTMTGTSAELRAKLGQETTEILEVVDRGTANPGTLYAFGSLRLLVEPLGSWGTSCSEGGNEACLAAFLSAGNVTVEFWADAPAPLISRYLGRVPSGEARYGITRMVKVPHHGSVDALVAELYSGSPKPIAIISVGPNSYGHPSPAVMDCMESASVPVFRTDESGALIARIIGGGFRISTQVGGRKVGR